MRGVDLLRYRFDFDLTFSALAMHTDGTIYHRYGGRDHRTADQWLTEPSFEAFLASGLEAHEVYRPLPVSIPGLGPMRIEEIPAFRKRDKGECIHCHSVFPALYEDALERGAWKDDDKWVFPPPSRIGLDLDRHEQGRVVAVTERTPAAQAGLKVGDVLTRLGDTSIATASDVMDALDQIRMMGGEVSVHYRRGDEDLADTLVLPDGWKRGTPLTYSWRPFKWGFTPAPGFGGPELDETDKKELGLEPGAFAFKVNYLVTWNENRRYGQEAARAGLRKGDVVLSVAGRTDFMTVQHFHSWWRLTREVGEEIPVKVLRKGREHVFTIEVLR